MTTIRLHRVRGKWPAFLFAGILLSILLAGCGSASAGTLASTGSSPTAQPLVKTDVIPTVPAASSLPPATDTPVPELTSIPSAVVPSIWLPDGLPADLKEALRPPDGWKSAGDTEMADLQVEIIPAGSQEDGLTTWIYALAAPFSTVTDSVTSNDVLQFWKYGPDADEPFEKLLVDPSTLSIFESLWENPSSAVQAVRAEQLLDTAWNTPGTWAIVPFEQLEPRWKVIQIDEQSPLQKSFNPESYPLSVRFALRGDEAMRERFLKTVVVPQGNRDPEKMTSVMLTGVTALVRGTASLMEVLGLTYPAKDIGPWLREADILHISNEVPFARNCPQPFEWKDLVFCSQTEYIKLLEDIGADVIELTGDHFADWGPEAMLYTLELYKERGWPYYGGGANLKEAQQPALLEHNGNKIAFLGCNGKEPGYATAGENTPGAAHCDFNLLTRQIRELRVKGYIPIVTFQHLEYYQYIALPELQTDFHNVSSAGAAIVSGSQAHQPHAFEFQDGAFLHYGLGNLFFDQTNQGDPPTTAFIDRHILYNGRHISTELLTIKLVDYARSRPMTQDERKALLETVFKASGW